MSTGRRFLRERARATMLGGRGGGCALCDQTLEYRCEMIVEVVLIKVLLEGCAVGAARVRLRHQFGCMVHDTGCCMLAPDVVYC